ncbi:DNA-3-methyladenine glycosylase 2 family protein [bacterium]|nr:MAG: DNA-3-methyladenine glycosylase 2 family protein [bacterium]
MAGAVAASKHPGMTQTLTHRLPFDAHAMLEYWHRDPQDAVDVVEGTTYRRVVAVNGNRAALDVLLADGEIALRVAAWEHTPHARDRSAVSEVASNMVGAQVDLAAFARAVAPDPTMAALERRFHGVKVPQTPTPFDALLWAILGQQISTAFAHALKRRLATGFGQPLAVRGQQRLALPSPEQLAPLDPEALATIGATRAKSRAIVLAARAVVEGTLDFEALRTLETESLIAHLCHLRGVGRWTAEYVAMRGFARTDSLPAGDVALQRAAGLAYGARYTAPDALRSLAKRWRGWESYATFYLWRTLSKPVG